MAHTQNKKRLLLYLAQDKKLTRAEFLKEVEKIDGGEKEFQIWMDLDGKGLRNKDGELKTMEEIKKGDGNNIIVEYGRPEKSHNVTLNIL